MSSINFVEVHDSYKVKLLMQIFKKNDVIQDVLRDSSLREELRQLLYSQCFEGSILAKLEKLRKKYYTFKTAVRHIHSGRIKVFSVLFCVPKGLFCALIVVPLCWCMPKPNTIFLRKKPVILWLPKQRGLFSSTGWKPQRCAKKRSFTSWGAWKGWTWCIWGVVTLRVPFLRVFPPFSLLVFAASYGWNHEILFRQYRDYPPWD